jgi:hypothetical protein
VQKGILVRVGDQVHISPAPAIAAARAALRDVFFPPEGHAAVTSVAGLHFDSDFVDEHEKAAGLTWQTGGKGIL